MIGLRLLSYTTISVTYQLLKLEIAEKLSIGFDRGQSMADMGIKLPCSLEQLIRHNKGRELIKYGSSVMSTSL